MKPHSTSVVVWDVPSTIVSGEAFSIKLGVKCSSECQLHGCTVEVRDQDGETRATATLSGEPWLGTSALYHVEVGLTAPEAPGLHEWRAEARGDGLEIPHSGSVVAFGVRAVPAPACRVRVVARDIGSGEPVERAKVTAHPYEAVTDETGVAELRLPEGEFRLFVSGRRYSPFRTDLDVKADVTVEVELSLTVELTDADIWS